MRLNEIEDDDVRITKIFEDHFETSDGKGNLDYSVWHIENGLINVDGNCKILSPLESLPVKFGEVKGNLSLQHGNLHTLVGCPTKVGKQFNITGQRLKSLQGGPVEVGGRYLCFNNDLKNFIGAPVICHDVFSAEYNPITSLDGLPTEINGALRLPYFDDLPLIKLLFIKNLTRVQFGSADMNEHRIGLIIEPIIEKYIGKGRQGALQCAAELTKLGFKRNARL